MYGRVQGWHKDPSVIDWENIGVEELLTLLSDLDLRKLRNREFWCYTLSGLLLVVFKA
jgi:hypothetical protein